MPATLTHTPVAIQIVEQGSRLALTNTIDGTTTEVQVRSPQGRGFTLTDGRFISWVGSAYTWVVL